MPSIWDDVYHVNPKHESLNKMMARLQSNGDLKITHADTLEKRKDKHKGKK